MYARLGRALEDLSAVDRGPRHTAAALALGVGLSFSPLLGLQILLGLGAAVAFRLSRVAVLIGLCANVPWIMVPWYALTTAGAAALLGTASDVDISERLQRILSVPFYRAAFWGHAGDLLDAYLWPFLIGPTVGALTLGAATYTAALRTLTGLAERKAEAAALAAAVLAGDDEPQAADAPLQDAPRPG